ncbi:hypothetical protein [Nostocoides jenkinsii]|jgi:ABC-type cobalamin transport system permease subunit|uniref:Uncharacterized protein n=1 Tax=Nostocoides jenkinsii Ben 74 TaxID=1193518 RepID=A0A077MGP1_9MICO|nr:hypothetical protein [Tetrasphaera jenkinsii]CCI54642.1 exported hypothetical protein [Tetrasphaera jenkinsii Ben 74]
MNPDTMLAIAGVIAACLAVAGLIGFVGLIGSDVALRMRSHIEKRRRRETPTPLIRPGDND